MIFVDYYPISFRQGVEESPAVPSGGNEATEKSDRGCKNTVNTAVYYLKASGGKISRSISTAAKDYMINYQILIPGTSFVDFGTVPEDLMQPPLVVDSIRENRMLCRGNKTAYSEA